MRQGFQIGVTLTALLAIGVPNFGAAEELRQAGDLIRIISQYECNILFYY